MRRMVALLVVAVVALALASTRADACLYAWQYRVFPLGTIGENLIAVVFDLHRTSDEDYEKTWWEGAARLDVLEKDGTLVRTVATVPVVDPLPGSSAQRSVLAAAWSVAAATIGFAPFAPPRVLVCGFRNDCGPVALRIEEGGAPVILLDGRLDKRRDVHVPSAVFDSLGWQLGFDDTPPEKRREEARAYFADASASFDVSTIRVYLMGGRRLVAANLGSGDTRDAADGPTGLARTGCPTLPGCFYPEPTPHHGSSFDVLVVD